MESESLPTPSLTSSSYRIPPLTGPENYLTWRIQISDILHELGLWDYVSGTNDKPKRGDSSDWQIKDRRALTTIRLRVSNDMMFHILSAETSKQAFDALANVFASEGSIARITLRRKLFSYRLEESDDLEAAIRDIKRLWIEYNLIKGASTSALTDNDLAMCILSALPPSWDGLVSSITVNDSLRSADLIGRIIQDDARRKAREPAASTVLYASRGEKKRKFRKGVHCHRCGKEGHIRPECTEPEKKVVSNLVYTNNDAADPAPYEF